MADTDDELPRGKDPTMNDRFQHDASPNEAGAMTSDAAPAACACGPNGCAPNAKGGANGGKKLVAAGIVAALAIGVPLVLKHRAAAASDGNAPGASCCAGHGEKADSTAPVTRAATRKAEPARPMPKLIDLGTTTCAPCKAMLGVMDSLEQSYADDLAVEFINVQDQPDAAERFSVKIIPTQVFLAADGHELYRHTGFFSADAIVSKWRELGYALNPKPHG